MKKKLLYTLAGCALFGLASCDLDINDNPNAITSIGNDNIFPTAEMNLAATMGVGFNVYGGYNAEVYSQNAGCSNYLDYSQFRVTSTNTNSSYTQLYSRVLQQLEVVRRQSAAEPGSYLAATALRAYTFQVLVDAYGETPYTEALTDETQPHYDEGADVYAGVIAELEAAKAGAEATSAVCANLTFGKTTATTGTAGDWLKFANSVLLKLYMRESGVADVKDKVSKLVAEDNFITEDVVYDKCWGNATGSYSPLYTEYLTIQNDWALNYAVSATYKSEGVNDMRLYALWGEGEKGMVGTASGSNLSTEMSGTQPAAFAQPAYSYDMPVYLMTVAEVEFFLAEYYAKMAVDHAKAKAHYEAAVSASFQTAGVADVAAAVVTEAWPYNAGEPMKAIGVQKWLHYASTLQGFEAWCEVRRIGYPAFSGQDGEDIIENDVKNFNLVPAFYQPGTLYTPKSVYSLVGDNKLLQRFDYAQVSTQYNNNVPATKQPTVPVFWNVK